MKTKALAFLLLLLTATTAHADCDSSDGTTVVTVDATQQAGKRLRATILTDCKVTPSLVHAVPTADGDWTVTQFSPARTYLQPDTTNLWAHIYAPGIRMKAGEEFFVLMGNRSVGVVCRYASRVTQTLNCTSLEYWEPPQ